jgi:hypothetical protein
MTTFFLWFYLPYGAYWKSLENRLLFIGKHVIIKLIRPDLKDLLTFRWTDQENNFSQGPRFFPSTKYNLFFMSLGFVGR